MSFSSRALVSSSSGMDFELILNILLHAVISLTGLGFKPWPSHRSMVGHVLGLISWSKGLGDGMPSKTGCCHLQGEMEWNRWTDKLPRISFPATLEGTSPNAGRPL